MVWIVLGILSAATICSFVLAARRRDWGSILASLTLLLITAVGWVLTAGEGYVFTPGVSAKLEITDTIAESEAGGFYNAQLLMKNEGDQTARSCRVEIEYRYAGEEEYTYLADAPLQPEDLSRDGQTYFWLVRGRAYKGAEWNMWIITSEIKARVEQGGSVTSFPPTFTGAGRHELRLTIIADNAKSSAREFTLTVFEESDRLPKLEVLR